MRIELRTSGDGVDDAREGERWLALAFEEIANATSASDTLRGTGLCLRYQALLGRSLPQRGT